MIRGHNNGVWALIRKKSRSRNGLYSHCANHRLTLVDVTKNIEVDEDYSKESQRRFQKWQYRWEHCIDAKEHYFEDGPFK